MLWQPLTKVVNSTLSNLCKVRISWGSQENSTKSPQCIPTLYILLVQVLPYVVHESTIPLPQGEHAATIPLTSLF